MLHFIRPCDDEYEYGRKNISVPSPSSSVESDTALVNSDISPENSVKRMLKALLVNKFNPTRYVEVCLLLFVFRREE